MMACRAGARIVYAVDASARAAGMTTRNAAENNMSNKIKVIHGPIESIPHQEKADVIISEWMGYALLFESMIDSVRQAEYRAS